MQDSFVPLIVAAGCFLAVLVWRVRPLVGWTARRRTSRQALAEARARAELAPDEKERARALCDAADLLAAHAHSRGDATGFYARAIRLDPTSVEIIDRAVAGLARTPRALELVLWRHLASTPWRQSTDATRAALDGLRALYEGPLRSAIRARALENAREVLKESA
jgi:hypothetical protein